MRRIGIHEGSVRSRDQAMVMSPKATDLERKRWKDESDSDDAIIRQLRANVAIYEKNKMTFETRVCNAIDLSSRRVCRR